MNRKVYKTRNLCVLLVLIAFLVPAAYADGTGSITGTVVDAEGSPLPGVSVTVSSLDGMSKRGYTDAQGKFNIGGLAAGTYDVSVELSGFVAITKTDIAVAEGENTIDFTMKTGSLAELIVVTASKIETPVINAPAAVSVVTPEVLETTTAQNYGDLLRPVPGLNVVQTSARDINLTSRQATSTLATSQLALLDGRSIYLDFFGFIAWDFLPVNFNEIKQVEVIRGPASAVWGANAQTGVVNIITKTPRESPGTSITITGGFFDRDVEGGESVDSGAAGGANVRHADVINDTWAYKISAGYYGSDALSRPIGTIPICSPLGSTSDFCPNTDPDTGVILPTGGAPYSLVGYKNRGTSQPRFDFRLDQELAGGDRLTYSTGLAATEGIVHTGIGPFDLDSGSFLYYGKVGYMKGDLKINFFTNILDADSQNLLTRGLDGQLIGSFFKTQTYDFEASHSMVLAEKHILSYGGNYRRNNFDLQIAAEGDNRNEIGGYIQDEFFTDKFRLVVGARVDKFSVIEDPVFSPRITAMFKPSESQAFRASFNKAFRSPSQINNFLDITIVQAVTLPGLGLFAFPVLAIGNPDLKEESLTAYEVGYQGEFGGRTNVTFAYYVNRNDDNINFTALSYYGPANPPPGWPLPPAFVPPNLLPSAFGYLNLGPFRSQGIEVSMNHMVNENLSFFANYSWQKEPEILDADSDQIPFPPSERIFPPKNRFNAGANFNSRTYLGSVTVNFTDKAFWTDVLDARFHGPTDSFTPVDVSFGRRWLDGTITTTIKVSNLFNEEIQQHIFGDIIKRAVNFEVRFDF